MTDKNIMVSVICAVYNHENYIRSALEGFVSQKTNFAYEVIIHDDASTDSSAEVIKEYAEKYPDIIKPILQKENQYSKGIDIEQEYIVPLLKGKYTAYCEGDDYWIDSNKLQKQVDFLEQHDEYSACVHNSYYEYTNGEKHLKYGCEDKDIFLEDVIVDGGCEYQTSSLFLRTYLLKEMPEWVNSIPGVGDYPMSIYMAVSGKTKYFGDIMSVYRVETPGSWTAKNRSNPEMVQKNRKNTLRMLYLFDEFYSHQYTDIINDKVTFLEYRILKTENKLKEVKFGKYRNLYLKETLTTKIMMHVKYYVPGVVRLKKLILKR